MPKHVPSIRRDGRRWRPACSCGWSGATLNRVEAERSAKDHAAGTCRLRPAQRGTLTRLDERARIWRVLADRPDASDDDKRMAERATRSADNYRKSLRAELRK